MSFFIDTIYDNLGGIQDLTLRKIQAFTRLKELEVRIDDDFIVHQVLNELFTSFDQPKVTYITANDKCNIYELISICIQEKLRISLNKVESANLMVHPNFSQNHIRIRIQIIKASNFKRSWKMGKSEYVEQKV